MSFVNFALLHEGSTDLAVLPGLLDKAVHALAHSDEIRVPFEWAIVPAGAPSDENVLAQIASGQYDVVLVHRDGGGSPQTMHQGILRNGGVPVVPVREMEAWLIADPKAFCRAARIPSERLPAGLPSSSQVESVRDPKAVMESILDACFKHPPRGGRYGELETFLEIVAAEVEFARLSRLSAFALFTRDLRTSLAYVGWPFNH